MEMDRICRQLTGNWEADFEIGNPSGCEWLLDSGAAIQRCWAGWAEMSKTKLEKQDLERPETHLFANLGWFFFE